MAAVAPASARAQDGQPAKALVQFRLVFTSRMFTEVHESDAKAAVKAWAVVFARERHIQAEPAPQVLDGLPALARAMEIPSLALFALTVDEYLELGANPEGAPLMASLSGGDYRVEYFLLVHTDSDIKGLADLRDRSVLIYENSRDCLALPWFDTILLEGKLPPAAAHCARVGFVKKLSGTVLPVFFRQADACIVPRDALATMSELNPQVGRQLRTLATSEKLLPSLSYVQVGEDEDVAFDLQHEVTSLHTTPAGKQLLTIFQAERIATVQPGALASARDLLARHARLVAGWERTSGKRGAARAVRQVTAGSGVTPGAAPRSSE